MSVKTRKGFTFVETLSVITILVVLASIVFTISSPLREKARQTVCAENLHQMQVAVMLYTDDVGAGEEFPGLGDLSDIPRYGLKVLNPYLKNKQVLSCPDFPPSLRGTLQTTYTWLPVVSRPGESPAEQERDKREQAEIDRVGTAFAMWVCGTHDEVFYRPQESDVSPLLVEPFVIEVSVAGSLYSGRRPYPPFYDIQAALSLQRRNQ